MKFDSIQALRAFAANAVLIAHLSVIEQKYQHGATLLPGWVSDGVFGVDVFFVISGFIMASLSSRDWRAFLYARALRILPPYWFYTSLVVAVMLIRPDWVNSSFAEPPSIWKSYLLIPSTTLPVLAVGWTLVFEAYFYLVFAAILAARLRYLLAVALWAAAIAALWLIFPSEAGNPAYPVLSTVASPLALDFIGGVVVALLLARFAPRWPLLVLIFGAAALAAALIALPDPLALTWDQALRWHRLALIGLPCMAIVYGSVGLEIKRKLSVPNFLTRLGDASYSTYLSHVLVASAVGRAMNVLPVGGPWYELALLTSCLVLANGVGLLSYRLLERPTLRLSRRFTPLPA